MAPPHQHHEASPLITNDEEDEELHLPIHHRKGHLQLRPASYHENESDDVGKSKSRVHHDDDDVLSTLASVAGNVLEWYDFAIYGYFSDIIGRAFFPPSADESTAIVESFLVFGGAFLARPLGGVLMGHVGDTLGRKRALEISIFLMAGPTFAMGCLPTYEVWGWWAVVALAAVRLLQGLSVGGQLMSSLVFVIERHDRKRWGYYGSCVVMTSNVGTLLGGVCGFGMRHYFTFEQLSNGIWRIPFLAGVLVSGSGFYLKNHVNESSGNAKGKSRGDEGGRKQSTPLELALSKKTRGSLLCATAAGVLWGGGFYMIFVWLVVFMSDLLDDPVDGAFAINAVNLFITMVALFPVAGWLSDVYGRKSVMTFGALGIALISPLAMQLIGTGEPVKAGASQLTLGILLCIFGSPLCAFLVEKFPRESRLTSVAIGYNTSMAIAGGMSPALATQLVRTWGPLGAGYLLSSFAIISLLGVHSSPDHNFY